MILQEVCLSKQGSSKSSVHNESKASNIATTTATSSSWSRLKDSRIVRASRAYGGKDRHSKVCTVKGLRDRRVRLSVPTAVQVYDLQDRLGLNQPSKVVDWLLHVAKHDIDDLPPLQFPQGSLIGGEGMDSDSDQPRKISRINVVAGKAKEVCEDGTLPYASQSQMNTCIGTQSPFFRVDPSNLSLFHIRRRSDGQTSEVEDWHNFSILPLQPALVYQPGMNMNARFFSSQNNEVKEQNNSNKFHPGWQ